MLLILIKQVCFGLYHPTLVIIWQTFIKSYDCNCVHLNLVA